MSRDSALTILADALRAQGAVTEDAPSDGSNLLKAAGAWVKKNTHLGVKMFKNLTKSLRKHPKKVGTVFVVTALALLIVRIGPSVLSKWCKQEVVTEIEFTDAQKLFARIARNPTWFGDIPEATAALIKRAVNVLNTAAESISA